MQTTKTKTQRKVYNAYTNIDCVTAEPGRDYRNWIEISEEKLKEREKKLLQHKVDVIQNIMNKILNLRIGREVTFELDKVIINSTISELNTIIGSWQGVNISRAKQISYSRFRDYFVRAKNWWDGRKKQMYGKVFWIAVFDYLRKVFQLCFSRPITISLFFFMDDRIFSPISF